MAARFLRTAHRALRSFQHSHRTLPPSFKLAASSCLFQSRAFATDRASKPPSEANILRILDNEIEYQYDYAPPHQPAVEFDSFVVEDRPGQQWMTMARKFGAAEEIKIEATMFDGYELVPKPGEDSSGEDLRLHISLLVDVSKVDGGGTLEFVCSAWPDRLEIQKLYLLPKDKLLGRPYLGPDFRSLSGKLQGRFRSFLEERGVDDKLSFFLHEYMTNKDRIELIQWQQRLKSFVEN
ncbi:unnamed protein product [Linum tenue]|uniref:Mitochondrial glycoprotein n=1 Tax=Linum tenue TaxID=586396 RepID=A0AAV0MBS2_9ROSI|nr:unnamed protein product [Linum tenue]